jgi:hypothetical protein
MHGLPAARIGPSLRQPFDPDSDKDEPPPEDEDGFDEDGGGDDDVEPDVVFGAQLHDAGASASAAASAELAAVVRPQRSQFGGTWVCCGCGGRSTLHRDTVMIMCQARDAPGGCCWHVGCLRGELERAAARRALAIPH